MMYELTGRVTKNVGEATKIYENASPEQQLKMLQALRDNSRKKQDIEEYQKLIELKKQEIRLQQQINNLEQLGVTDEKTAMERAKNRSIKDRVNKNNQQARTQFQKQRDIQGQIDTMKDNAEYGKITDDQQKILYLQKKLTEQQEKEKNLARQQQEIENATYGDERERFLDKKRMLELEQKIKQARERGTPQGEQDAKAYEKQLLQLQTKVYKTDGDRSADQLAYQRLETDRLQVLKQQVE